MSNYNLEQTILKNIIVNENFMRKALPFIKSEYFEGPYHILFKELCKYVDKYNKLPTEEAFRIELDDTSALTEETYKETMKVVPYIFIVEEIEEQWILDKTEEWCRKRALFIGIMKSISIIDGKDEKLTENAIPDILTKALAVGFDTNIGHDYIDDFEHRYEFYHTDLQRIPSDLDYINKILKGGYPNKSLTIVMAGTAVGKSLFMCHTAAAALSMGFDVLYITMEMSEEKIAERIDANLFDVAIDQLENISLDMFKTKIKNIKSKTNGKLKIKEYPTGQPSAAHFRALLNELKLKKQFTPQIIIVDYLNICSSARYKFGGSINSNSYVKSIAEELRGLAIEFDVPIISATQVNRGGYDNSDPELTDTAESFGLTNVADIMFVLITDENLERDNQMMVKQLKNRYADVNKYRRFILGIDRQYMRLFDADEAAQNDVVKDRIDPPNISEINEEKNKEVKEFIF